MKETGLMFKAPLVRAILSGQKTQTRRVVKPQPVQGQGMVNAAYCGDRHLWLRDGACDVTDPAYEWRCPFGKPGDRIYVRETWNPDPPCDGTWGYTAWAGCRSGQIEGVPEQFRSPEHCMYAATSDADLVWTPSIHMPKWAARIWLEITGVRVERLRRISDADALAEGVDRTNTSIPGYARERFKALWDSTTGRPVLPRNENSKRYARIKHWLDTHPDTTGWSANPWVWVIDFKRIEKP